MKKISKISNKQKVLIESAVLRRLIKHLQEKKNLQNIDLMNLAGFCRNCLAKWFADEAQKKGYDKDVNFDSIREIIYGMPYEDWKKKYQKPIK